MQQSRFWPTLASARRGTLRPALAVLAAVVVAAAAIWANPAEANHIDGTCLESGQMPCTATGGQTYATVALGADANDDEASVEAVLAHLFGAPMSVSEVARGVTGDSTAIDVSPDDLTSATAFTWTYRGPSASLAYLTVKASNGFAVFGIAGTTSGSIDVTDLLGGHGISHISLWSIDASPAAPVRATRLHGRGLLGNSRLGRIEGGRVPCVHVETVQLASCRFGRNSGDWIESASGDYAVSGQAISLDGKPGGEYIIAARINRDGSVPALAPTGRDSAGTATGMELGWQGVVETMLSPYNGSRQTLQNYATREVCTSSYPHPDGARMTRSPSPGIYCYTGRGAALNDVNGTERDEYNRYLMGWQYTHVSWVGGYEVFVAKRPATVSWPSPGYVKTDTPIVWRPVASTISIAN